MLNKTLTNILKNNSNIPLKKVWQLSWPAIATSPISATYSKDSKLTDQQEHKQLIETHESNGIRNIILNDPKTRNSLSLEMMNQLIKAIHRNKDDENLRCIILSAPNGSKIFSAGHNLKELTNSTSSTEHKLIFARASDLMMVILKSSVPVIAKVDGLAAAAGCQLVAGCDMIVCSDRSSFSTPGANFGIFCSTPGISIARSMNRKVATKMLFTGNAINANEALNAGLVSTVVTADKLDEEVEKTCLAIIQKSRSVISLGKKFFYEQISMDVQVAYQYGAQVMTDNLKLSDGQEGVRSFIEKRKPNWSHSNE